MIRVLLAAICLMLGAATLQAGGLDDLKAAKVAMEAGNADEAIRLFNQALAATTFRRPISWLPARAVVSNTPP